MRSRTTWLGVAILALGAILTARPASASSHREALAVLGDPCADFADLYAWVSPGAHDKLYLIATGAGGAGNLHEPGQGNQGVRACSGGWRYAFHIGTGTSIIDKVTYYVTFNKTVGGDDPAGPDDGLGGGNELLWQITGGTETYNVVRFDRTTKVRTTIGQNLATAPNRHGPQTDRLVNQLGSFQGYDSGNPASRTVDLYDDDFAATFVQPLTNGGRAFTGQRDDPYYLDEKGIFDLVNLCADGLFGIAGARTTDCEDVFTGFNTFAIALEIPMSDIFPDGIPHNGTFVPGSTDSLLRIWVGAERREREIVDPTNVVTGYRYEGPYRQVGRHGNPLFNAGLVGTARHTTFLRMHPRRDVSNFGSDILFPVLVRDAEALGLYAALGIDPEAAGLKGPRMDIINAINLGRPIPIADGFTADVLTLDASIGTDVVPNGVLEGGYPNGRQLVGSVPDAEHRDVSDLLISLIVAGDPLAGAGDGVDSNDKNYLTAFPFAAGPHSGLNGGHGGTNVENTP
jgi:hypothetical protein